MQAVRIYEMPACKMVSSQKGMFGEEAFEKFDEWLSSQKRGLFPRDFLYWAGDGFVWLYMYEEGMDVPKEFTVLDFPGGLYAVAADIDEKTDMERMNAEIDVFLQENGLMRDASRAEIGNVITSPKAKEIMGYDQMDYYFPVQAK